MSEPAASPSLCRHARACSGVAVALVALLASALAAQTASLQTATAQTAPHRISMFGDSVMLGARDRLLASFPDASVTVDAVEDRSLLGAVSVLQAAQPLGDVVVLDLGYNDADDPTVFRQRIDTAMAVLATVPQVIWLNQREFKAGRAGMNAELAAAAGRYGNLQVIDWNAEVAAHPEDVYADGIHLTPPGQVAMAALVRRAFDAYLASLAPPTTTAPASTSTTAPPTQAPAPAAAAGSGTHPGASSSTDPIWLIVIGAGAALVAGGVLLLFARRWFARA
jgi:hypothetical protein